MANKYNVTFVNKSDEVKKAIVGLSKRHYEPREKLCVNTCAIMCRYGQNVSKTI